MGNLVMLSVVQFVIVIWIVFLKKGVDLAIDEICKLKIEVAEAQVENALLIQKYMK